MRAFTRQLTAKGGKYTAQYLSEEEIASIVGGENERCGQGGGGEGKQGQGGKGRGQGKGRGGGQGRGGG